MFVQITELGPEGERDWLVQAENPIEAYDLLVDLLSGKETYPLGIELKLVGAISDKDVADLLKAKNPEQFAFVCINSYVKEYTWPSLSAIFVEAVLKET